MPLSAPCDGSPPGWRAAAPMIAISPAMIAPRSGRKTTAEYKGLALHHVDVLNRDGAAVAVLDDEDGKADRRLRGGDRQHQQGKNLPGQVAEESGEGDEVQVDGDQDQLD